MRKSAPPNAPIPLLTPSNRDLSTTSRARPRVSFGNYRVREYLTRQSPDSSRQSLNLIEAQDILQGTFNTDSPILPVSELIRLSQLQDSGKRLSEILPEESQGFQSTPIPTISHNDHSRPPSVNLMDKFTTALSPVEEENSFGEVTPGQLHELERFLRDSEDEKDVRHSIGFEPARLTPLKPISCRFPRVHLTPRRSIVAIASAESQREAEKERVRVRHQEIALECEAIYNHFKQINQQNLMRRHEEDEIVEKFRQEEEEMQNRAIQNRQEGLIRLQRRVQEGVWVKQTDRVKERKVFKVYRHSFQLESPAPLSQFFLVLTGTEASLQAQLKFFEVWAFAETRTLFECLWPIFQEYIKVQYCATTEASALYYIDAELQKLLEFIQSYKIASQIWDLHVLGSPNSPLVVEILVSDIQYTIEVTVDNLDKDICTCIIENISKLIQLTSQKHNKRICKCIDYILPQTTLKIMDMIFNLVIKLILQN